VIIRQRVNYTLQASIFITKHLQRLAQAGARRLTRRSSAAKRAAAVGGRVGLAPAGSPSLRTAQARRLAATEVGRREFSTERGWRRRKARAESASPRRGRFVPSR